MRDADHLWRVHLGHLKAYPPESTITRAALKDRLLKSCRFHTEVARQVAEIKVENSIGAM